MLLLSSPAAPAAAAATTRTTTSTTHRRPHAALCLQQQQPGRGRTVRARFRLGRDTGSNAQAPAAPAQQPPTASLPVLTKEEQQSLTAFLAAHGLPAGAEGVAAAAAAAQRTPDLLRAVDAVLARGLARQPELDLATLEGAMLLAEQLHHASSGDSTGAASLAQLPGVELWQPVFASAGGFPRLLYIPVPEYFDLHRSLPEASAISIDDKPAANTNGTTPAIRASSSPERAAAAAGPASGRINIVTELGPLTTHFLGSCSWLSDTAFEYAITQLRLDLGGRSVTLPLPGPLSLRNALTFFHAAPGVACARSRLGGTMLLAAEPEAGRRYLNAW